MGRQVPLGGCVLNTAGAAAVLGVPLKTLEWWRRDRRGPVCMHIGRHVRYRSEDLREWLAEQAEAGRALMAQNRLPMGEHGEVWTVPYGDRWQARVKVRDRDGARREVSATGDTEGQARRRFKEKLDQRGWPGCRRDQTDYHPRGTRLDLAEAPRDPRQGPNRRAARAADPCGLPD
ncbi:helix-turn-helix domain-containing protein [Nocardioides sp. GXZ039]|uniref:helix-turn-helix domain-containing protein n=1 Tax=Nocardioides sp. GXZ039 TaxID=3136018 RepID=UPI0040408A7A